MALFFVCPILRGVDARGCHELLECFLQPGVVQKIAVEGFIKEEDCYSLHSNVSMIFNAFWAIDPFLVGRHGLSVGVFLRVKNECIFLGLIAK